MQKEILHWQEDKEAENAKVRMGVNS